MTESAKTLRDEGINKVMSHNLDWKRQAMFEMMKLKDCEVTGESIRLFLEKRGIVPDHPNAWGGFIRGLVKAKRLFHTGRYTRTISAQSHARETRIYTVRAL